MKLITDSKRRDAMFNRGDWVMVKLRPYRQSIVTGVRGGYSKLAKRFYGPFQIVERIGPMAYKLLLLEGACIHPVFHCSLLKPFHGTPGGDPQLPLPSTVVANQPLIASLAILDTRHSSDSTASKWEVLVQWDGLFLDDTSWEDWEQLRSDYHLEDKVFSKAEGDDSNQGVQAATRNRPKRNTTVPTYLRDFV